MRQRKCCYFSVREIWVMTGYDGSFEEDNLHLAYTLGRDLPNFRPVQAISVAQALGDVARLEESDERLAHDLFFDEPGAGQVFALERIVDVVVELAGIHRQVHDVVEAVVDDCPRVATRARVRVFLEYHSL